MQRLVQRDKEISVLSKRKEDKDAVDDKLDDNLLLELTLVKMEQQLSQTPVTFASLPAKRAALSLDGVPGKFRTSSRSINLHSHDPQSHKVNGYTETKIGGHVLDYKRPFSSDWQQRLHGPLTTSVWSAMGVSGDFLTGLAAALPVPSSQTRTSLAYSAPKPEVLVYSAVKIGGHPLDHVPFRCRGLPSRPLLGHIPESTRQEMSPSFQTPGLSSTAVTYETAPNMTNFGTCFLECLRCNDMVAVEAVAFTNYIIRMEPFSACTVSMLKTREAPTHGMSISLTGAWKQGGVLAALSFIAGRFVLSSKSSSKARRKKLDAIEDAKRLIAKILPDKAEELLVDGVAALSKKTAKADVSIAKGPERWAKRVQGLQPPSKLLTYSFLRTLGVGNFAEVMLVENRKGKFAVLKESNKLSEAANEISMLSRVRSPHVVQIRQYFIEEIGHRHFVYIEMEYCDGGDLRQTLEAKGRLEADIFDSMFRQLCLGLKEIHRHGIVHRDLKPSNVLLMSDGATKIADFGVSTYLESDLLTHHAAGTLAFMAPEVRRYFLGEVVSYDFKADIWSLGALAVAMLTGNPEPRVATRPVEEILEELKEQPVDERCTMLVKGMLATHPADRISLETVLTAFPAMKSRL
ncbi:unnamed protein product [Peronospora destructor]|uniref:Protein kinase domain-containing protein n=1 Tax=Peronospora destructor TaxID=86335 RepID=A0AAV0UI85_9STRA|nr:unnamed protein product [Peronospora destructor]